MTVTFPIIDEISFRLFMEMQGAKPLVKQKPNATGASGACPGAGVSLAKAPAGGKPLAVRLILCDFIDAGLVPAPGKFRGEEHPYNVLG